MQSKPNKEHSGFRGRTAAIVCAAIVIAGGVAAVHILPGRKRAEPEEHSRFHISSNYLEEDGSASYSVVDWGSGFDILLYNCEQEDITQISNVDMTYRVTAEHASVRVQKQNGEPVTEADGVYTFGMEVTTAYHILHVTPEAGTNDVAVTVQTASPFQKTLTAEFQVQHYRKPDYTVQDQNDGTVLLTVNTNDYQDYMTVAWEAEKYSPDQTNALMASWSDDAPIGYFPVSRDSTYELLFFKKTDDLYLEQKGADTVITLD